MSSLVCPPPEVLRKLAFGRVPAERERELDRHLSACARCRQQHDDHFRPILAAVRELSVNRSRGPAVTVVAGGPPPGLCEPDSTVSDLGSLGKFRLLEILGEGGMGRVYRARDTSLNREVALKVILLRGRSTATVEQRRGLFGEAQAAAKLDDDNIVPVYEVGEIDDTPYLVMPLLNGGTLGARLRRGPMALHEACRIGGLIARGLAAAHGAGLVHRDIKPANVWLEPKPGGDAVRVLDFGLARPLTEVTAGLAGTPAYMAPEQAAGRAVDARADLFSLGVVLFEMLTGRRLFPGAAASMTELLVTVKEFDSPSGAKLLPGAPPRLSAIVADLLRNDPQRRTPDDAEELADTLTALAAEFAPGRRRQKLLRLAQTALLIVASAAVVLIVVQAKKEFLDAPVSLARLPRQADSGGEKPTPLPVVAAPEPPKPAPRPPAIVVGEKLTNLDHLDRSHIPRPALTLAGDGDPNRVAPEVVAALTQSGTVEAVALHPKGKILASAGSDQTVRLWNLAESPPKELAVLREHTAIVTRLAFTADGTRLISGAENGMVVAWRLVPGSPESVVQRFDTGAPVTAIGAGETGDLVAVGNVGGLVRVFDVTTGSGGDVVRGNSSNGINSVVFTDGDRKLIVGSSGFLRLIDLANDGKELWNLAESKVWFTAVAISPDRARFVANGYGYVAGERPGALVMFPGLGNNRDIERQHSLSVRALSGDPTTQKKLAHTGRVVRSAWTPDGHRLVTLVDDAKVHVWNWSAEIKLASAVLAFEKVEHRAVCRDMVLHPDGRHAIVCRTNGQVLVVRFSK